MPRQRVSGGSFAQHSPDSRYPTWREQTIVGERDVVPVDPDADALQLAMLGINPLTAYSMLHGYLKLESGAWVAQTADENLAERARESIGDATIEPLPDAVGGEPATQLASLVNAGGAVISYSSLGLKPVSVMPQDLIFRGLTIYGYWLYNWMEAVPGARCG
jgi:NADPH:quinone reductase-like Zn-dependent oxidoreductase